MVRASAWRNFIAIIRREWRSFLIVGVISWAVALGLNVALMAFRYGTTADHHAPVVARGNAVGGAVLWTALSVLVTSIVGYRVRVGRVRFWTEVREFPVLVRVAASTDGQRTATHLLWGFAGTMLVVVTFAPALVAAMAIGTVFFLAGPARAIVVATCTSLWRRVGRRVGSLRATPPPPVAMLIGACGTASAFVVGAFAGGPAVRVALAILAAVIGALLARRATAAVALIVIVALPIAAMMRTEATPASAAAPAVLGTVHGTVKDARGKGVVGIEVTADGPTTKGSATDGAEGAYSIAKLPEGTYRVVPRDPKDDRQRFTPEYKDVELGKDAEVQFTVNAAGGGGGDTATTVATNDTTATTAAPATTEAPKTTTPKVPRTLSTGSTAVADFVVKAATRNLKPAHSQSAQQAAAAGSAAAKGGKLPTPTTLPRPSASPSGSPSPNQIPRPPPFTLPAQPVVADCRDVRDRLCYYDIGFIDFTLSRHILKVGERVTGTVSFDLVYNEAADAKCQARLASGGVERCPVYSWSWVTPPGLAAVGGGPTKATKSRIAANGRYYDLVQCLSGKEIASATCDWIVTAPTQGWVTGTALGAVLEGFAAGSYVDGDFFAVVPADVTVIEGTVRDEEGKGVPGVTVHMDGSQKYTSVTDSTGWYFHIVDPGDYNIYAEVAPALGFGKPTILPTKHQVKLTAAKSGSSLGDLQLTGPGPATGSLLHRLKSALAPGVLLLAALLLAPVIPGSTLGLGIAHALSDLASPAGNLLKKLPKPRGPGDAASGPHRPDWRDYPSPSNSDYMEIRKRMQDDWNQYLRDTNSGLTWEQISAAHNTVAEANKLYANWLLTHQARKPIEMADDAKTWISGYLELVAQDNDTGGMWNRVAALPTAAFDIVSDLTWGPPDPKTGLRGEGGVYGVMAEEIRRHGPFAVFPLAFRFAAHTVNSVTGDLGKYTVVLQETWNMTPAQRDKYLRDNSADVPYIGWMYDYQKAVDSGDPNAMAKSAIDLAQRLSGAFDGRPKEGYFQTAAELERHLASRATAAERAAFREQFGHDMPTDAELATVAAAGTSATATPPTVSATPKSSAWDSAVSRPDHEVIDLRSRASHVLTPEMTPEQMQARKLLLERAAASPDGLKITSKQAQDLLGIEEPITLERGAQLLQYSEGKGSKGMSATYKLGDDTAVVASRLRVQNPDIWTGKWNPVADKGWVPGEEALLLPQDRARFEANPPKPGETVNYTPREMTAGDLAALPAAVADRYNARSDSAGKWDHYSSVSTAKTVDYADPGNIERYGQMFVPEDPGRPVAKAQFWKDPDDNRIYVRYQTADGVWHPPKRQASDIDTIHHTEGSSPLTYEQSRDLLAKGSMGQIGEGDSARWAQTLITQDPAGHWVIKDPKNQDMLVKAIDTLTKGQKDVVLRQDLDGLRLMKIKFPELENLKAAARAIDAKGGWDDKTRPLLVGWGVVPDAKPVLP